MSGRQMSAIFFAPFLRGFFVITKGVLMQKVSYMGNDSAKEFYFNFPYFENSNIIVTVNNKTAPAYNIIGTSGGLDADIPYSGGKIVFDVAPTSLDSITISRKLPLIRVTDYQPLAKIEPTVLNQDMNYLLEIIKDQQDELDDFRVKYSDITNQESTQHLLSRIDTVSQQITDLGDISDIHEDITTLETRTDGMTDYVIASQIPTETNNYTWYRKYKSGWIEQGGIIKMAETSNQWAGVTVFFPHKMANNMYTAIGTAYGLDAVSTLVVCIGGISAENADNGTGKTKTSMFVQTEKLHSGTTSRVRWIHWHVSGIAG